MSEQPDDWRSDAISAGLIPVGRDHRVERVEDDDPARFECVDCGAAHDELDEFKFDDCSIPVEDKHAAVTTDGGADEGDVEHGEHVVDDVDVFVDEFAEAAEDAGAIVTESQASAMFLRDVVGLKREAAAAQADVSMATLDRNRLRGRRNLAAAARTLGVAQEYDLLDEYGVDDVLAPVCSGLGHDAAQTPLQAFARQVSGSASGGVDEDAVEVREHAYGFDVVLTDEQGVEHTIKTVDTGRDETAQESPAEGVESDADLWAALATLDGLSELNRRDDGDAGSVILDDDADVINRAQNVIKASGFYVRGQPPAGKGLARILFRRQGTDEGQDTPADETAQESAADADTSDGVTYGCTECGNVTEDANMPMTNCVECGGDLEVVDDGDVEHSDEWQAFLDTYESDEHDSVQDTARDGIDALLHYNAMRPLLSHLRIGAGTGSRPGKQIVLDRLVDAGVFVDPFSEQPVVETVDGIVVVDEDVDVDLQDVTTPSADYERLSSVLADAQPDGGQTDE